MIDGQHSMASTRYADSPVRSAEILRLALPLMSRQAAGVHPMAYAVWYEHCSGRNAALSCWTAPTRGVTLPR